MFYVIGIGLSDEKDITVKGLEIVKKCARVYLEAYTSVIGKSKQDLEKFYGRVLETADRETVEQNVDVILADADTQDVALLVVGDPFGATTHADIILRARNLKIPTKIVHNASIMNAVGCCGLQLYNFGETISIPFWTGNWKPDSFVEKIARNRRAGLHTLCLLDIRVKEPTVESLTKKKKEYEPPRFMTVNQASDQLLRIIENNPDCGISEQDQCVGLSRVGSDEEKIVTCSLLRMKDADLGPPLHSLVLVGNLHPLEREFLSQFFTK